jgi:hypothetical protein
LDQRDLIVTPIVILVIYVLALMFRPLLTDEITRRYFIPALTVRIIGALAVGFIYQFYYHGGDTYNFHTIGSRYLWEAFWESPSDAIDMFFANGVHKETFYRWSSRLYFFSDPSSYFVIRLAAIIDMLTFSAYSATAVIFSVFSFLGAWAFFITFYRKYPALHKWMAFATLFIPSVFFWGSGLLKDTIVLAALGVLTYEIDRLFFRKRISIFHCIVLLVSCYVILSVKIYVLEAYLPVAIIWIYLGNIQRLNSFMLRIILFPFVIAISGVLSYFAAVKIGEGDKRYAVETLGQTAKVTAMDIRYYSGKDAGSGYSLGELDGTLTGMLVLAPQAVNVSLFRPYLWEVNNVLMLLSALESLALTVFILLIILKKKMWTFRAFNNPDVFFCIVFAVMFAFAVGVSTYNFGTLARYKIPLLPFFTIGLTLMLHWTDETKEDKLDDVE